MDPINPSGNDPLNRPPYSSAGGYPASSQGGMGVGGYYPAGSGYGYGGYGSYGLHQASEILSPRRLLKVIRRRWFLILVLLLLGSAAATIYFLKAERVYEASSLIEMSVRGPRVARDIVSQDFGNSDEVFNTRLGRLRGTHFGMIAAERFGLLWDAHGVPTASDARPEFAKINYSLVRNSRLVRIQAKTDDPLVAAISANAAAEAAEMFFQQENKNLSDAAVEWLDKQAAVQKAQLMQMEDQLLAFRTSNKLDALRAQQDADRQSLLSLNAMLINLEADLLRAQEFLKTVQMIDPNVDAGMQIPNTLPNRERIIDKLQVYREAKAQRLVLLERYTDKHPNVLELDLRLAELLSAIRQEIALSQNSFTQQINVLEGQRVSVVEKIAERANLVTQQELKIVEYNSRLQALERERDAAEMSYKSILSRIEEARLAADEDTATVKVRERATVDNEPIHPEIKVILPIGIAAGLLLGLLFAIAAEAVEDRIFSIAELEANISSRIIGIIPHIPGRKRADLALISLNQKFGQVAESFNAVRVLLDHLNNRRLRDIRAKGHAHPGGQVIMFCSASPSEGKTVSASNVAITSARGGQKTLLIDCDMRRPRLGKVFEDAIAAAGGDPEQYSLLHHLDQHGGRDFEKLILPGPTENLSLMASLSSTEINPADMLGGKDIESLVLWARQNFDRVIIDTPPIGIISDGLVLAGLSDGVVVVCRTGQTRHRALRHVLLQFKGVGAAVVGIIVNDFNMKKVHEPMDVHYRDFAGSYTKSGYDSKKG